MRVLIDACVLYPTVLREIVLGTAATGAFTPLWSPRILGEWARAAARLAPGSEVIAQGEIALLRARWPGAEVAAGAVSAAQQAFDTSLPDPDDGHVLAAAIAGRADLILTLNLRDFPRAPLAAQGLRAEHPDPFLLALWHQDRGAVGAVLAKVQAEAARVSGRDQPMRALLKRARLPRLGKAADQAPITGPG
ncbi:putative nucleic acid-binding protein [Rhodobacteraceae bacterium MBR-64]|jgi:predicted nucleic acid-binding protein